MGRGMIDAPPRHRPTAVQISIILFINTISHGASSCPLIPDFHCERFSVSSKRVPFPFQRLTVSRNSFLHPTT